MRKTSSNEIMDNLDKILGNIKSVDPSSSIYTHTLSKIQAKNTIPMIWVKIAACFLVLLFAAEFHFGIKANSQNKIESNPYVYSTPNTLYNE